MGSGDHFAQFYESDSFLVAALHSYVATGLGAGDGVIIVATEIHLEQLRQLLTMSGLDFSVAIASEQLTFLDAAQTLGSFLVDAIPNEARFHQTVDPVMAKLTSKFPGVRVFGEMVALLWQDGNYSGAITLEGFWNKLQEKYSFSLFCAYPISAAANEEFTHVCSEHDYVIPAESYVALDNPDDRTRAIIRLQQHASLLQAEVAERKQAEALLHQVRRELELQVHDLRQLHEMSATLTRTLDADSVLKEVLRAAMLMQGTDRGLLSLCDDERENLTVAVHDGFDDEFLESIEIVPLGNGACGNCLRLRQRVIVEDVELEPLMSQYREWARKVGFRAVHATPLITREGSIIGVLSVHFRDTHRPTDREMRLMDLYAHMAADIIENARLHQRVQDELAEREQLLSREQVARADAETASRMKDEFLATVSHELRTPLNAIIGWSHMLRSGRLDSDSFQRAIETIERNAKAQAQLVEDILDVSRVITGKLHLNTAPVDLAAVINSSVDSVQLAAESKDIQLEVTLAPAARFTIGDAARLQQVVWNLLSNAIKFTPHGGRVEVKLEGAGQNVRIMIIDSGQGIAPEFLPYIFERFRQADGTSTRRHGGLGLGLAIVRHLVELHGGTVSAHSGGEGMGTTFTVEMPLVVPERAKSIRRETGSLWPTSQIEPEPAEMPSLAGVKLLLVDDDPDSLQVVIALLREYRAEVESVSSVAEAMDVLKRYRPDVLVSDLAMPVEDGYSLIKKVRALDNSNGSTGLSTIPAIALTSYVRIEDRTRALAEGFNMFVPKPIQPNELINAVANLVESSAKVK